MQVDAVATTVREARAIDATAMGQFVARAPTNLRGFAGALDASPAFEVLGCQAQAAIEFFEGENVKDCRVSRDYLIWYRES